MSYVTCACASRHWNSSSHHVPPSRAADTPHHHQASSSTTAAVTDGHRMVLDICLALGNTLARSASTQVAQSETTPAVLVALEGKRALYNLNGSKELAAGTGSCTSTQPTCSLQSNLMALPLRQIALLSPQLIGNSRCHVMYMQPQATVGSNAAAAAAIAAGRHQQAAGHNPQGTADLGLKVCRQHCACLLDVCIRQYFETY